MRRIDGENGVYALTDGVGYSIHHEDECELDEPMQAWTVPPRYALSDDLFEDLRTAGQLAGFQAPRGETHVRHCGPGSVDRRVG